jgi:hypothetical protein
MDELIDLRSMQTVVGNDSEPANALEYLQDIYRGRRVFDPQRVRAAALALPFESSKLAVTAHIGEDGTFAERLDRALMRSGVRVIEHRPAPEPND